MPDQPKLPDEPNPEIRERALKAFMSVLDSAVEAHEAGRLYAHTDEEELYIRQEVERMLYEPQLPNGGSKEQRMIERFKKLLQNKDWHDEQGRELAERSIKEWKKVLPADPRNPGRYYTRKPLNPRLDKERYKWLTDMVEIAHQNRWWDIKWFAQMILDGPPEPVSDFEMECLFVLRKSDGKVDRLVRLRNILGEVSKGPHHQGSDILDPISFAAPEKFRAWCLGHGNFSWKGNQTDLHKLHEDNTHNNAWRVINQVDSVGSYRVGKHVIWFCDECAYVTPFMGGVVCEEIPSGPFPIAVCLRPDADGINWWDGEGYYLNPKGRETEFRQGRPRMHPDKKIKDFFPEAEKRDEREILGEFYHELSTKFRDTLGDHQASLCVGAMMAYSAAPEIFAEHGLFPGLFIHGEAQSGKTKFTEWLMYMRGYERSAGIGLLKASAVGLLCESENYSNEPIWADEFRNLMIKPEVEAVLRDSYNRQPPLKWSSNGVQREMKTSFVISGESTSSDAAMRSRFLHAQVSAQRRIGNHLVCMEANKHKFFLITRFVHENRAEFVTNLKYYLRLWQISSEPALINDRARLVHGIDYAAWMALCRMLPGHSSEEVVAFKSFMHTHVAGSAADVTSETNVMVFLTELLTAVKAGEIPLTCFRIRSELAAHPPGRPNQGRWIRRLFFIDPNSTIGAMEVYMTKRHSRIPLSRKDLRDQLSKLPCWVQLDPGKKLNVRFGPGNSTTLAWGFDLDRMSELGYRPCSDEEWLEYESNPDNGDPRKGPFYEIVDMLETHERKMREPNSPT